MKNLHFKEEASFEIEEDDFFSEESNISEDVLSESPAKRSSVKISTAYKNMDNHALRKKSVCLASSKSIPEARVHSRLDRFRSMKVNASVKNEQQIIDEIQSRKISKSKSASYSTRTLKGEISSLLRQIALQKREIGIAKDLTLSDKVQGLKQNQDTSGRSEKEDLVFVSMKDISCPDFI